MDIATVCYTPELNFLRLQARSMARHLDPSGIDRIWVVLNEAAPSYALGYVNREIVPEYGIHARSVRVVDAQALIPDLFATEKGSARRGWRTQQALKLQIAHYVGSATYLLLDAKNHFIRDVSAGSFFDETQRYRGFLTNHRRGDRHETEFRASYEYFGLDAEEFLGRAPATITPVGLRTALVRDMLQTIRAREQMEFAAFFFTASATHFTEFLLVQAYLVATTTGYERDFTFGERNAATLFRGKSSVTTRFNKMARLVRNEHVLTMALHRSVLHELTESQRRDIGKIWRKAGLLNNESEVGFFTMPFVPGSPAPAACAGQCDKG